MSVRDELKVANYEAMRWFKAATRIAKWRDLLLDRWKESYEQAKMWRAAGMGWRSQFWAIRKDLDEAEKTNSILREALERIARGNKIHVVVKYKGSANRTQVINAEPGCWALIARDALAAVRPATGEEE